MLKVITDHKWKQFKYGYEVPARVLRDQFAHLIERGEADDGFFRYRGNWYHVSDFVSFRSPWSSPDNPLAKLGWQASAADSFFSGIVIKVSPDGEEYQVGLYLE